MTKYNSVYPESTYYPASFFIPTTFLFLQYSDEESADVNILSFSPTFDTTLSEQKFTMEPGPNS